MDLALLLALALAHGAILLDVLASADIDAAIVLDLALLPLIPLLHTLQLLPIISSPRHPHTFPLPLPPVLIRLCEQSSHSV